MSCSWSRGSACARMNPGHRCHSLLDFPRISAAFTTVSYSLPLYLRIVNITARDIRGELGVFRNHPPAHSVDRRNKREQATHSRENDSCTIVFLSHMRSRSLLSLRWSQSSPSECQSVGMRFVVLSIYRTINRLAAGATPNSAMRPYLVMTRHA